MTETEKLKIREWLELVNTEGRNLTAWELSFMESITDQFERWETLSERQIEILEQIYAEKTS